jgi:hypothetical protein
VEKLLLAEIDALTTDTDACYATNTHFSERLSLTATKVGSLARETYSAWIHHPGVKGIK